MCLPETEGRAEFGVLGLNPGSCHRCLSSMVDDLYVFDSTFRLAAKLVWSTCIYQRTRTDELDLDSHVLHEQ